MHTRRRTLRRLFPLSLSPSPLRRSGPLAESPRQPGVRPGPVGVDCPDRRWLELGTQCDHFRWLGCLGRRREPRLRRGRIARESGGRPGRDGGGRAVRFRPRAFSRIVWSSLPRARPASEHGYDDHRVLLLAGLLRRQGLDGRRASSSLGRTSQLRLRGTVAPRPVGGARARHRPIRPRRSERRRELDVVLRQRVCGRRRRRRLLHRHASAADRLAPPVRGVDLRCRRLLADEHDARQSRIVGRGRDAQMARARRRWTRWPGAFVSGRCGPDARPERRGVGV